MANPPMEPDSPPSLPDPLEGRESAAHYGNLSVLETAAQRGFGPLSELGQQVWHGESKPCVSCGELVHRSAERCDNCEQDLGVVMLDRMHAFAGPWYVMEHIRPFPGVTLERLVKQARRGVLTRTTVVRGPTTDHQWRFAGETPGLSQHVGCCWRCQAQVAGEEGTCPACSADLKPIATTLRSPELGDSPMAVDLPLDPRLQEFSASINLRGVAAGRSGAGSTRPGTAAIWFAAALIVVLLAMVLMLVQLRSGG